MKPLLSKTTTPFLLYVLIVFVISIPVYYAVVDAIWREELDEHNLAIAEKTSLEFNELKLSETELKESIALWNKIQPNTNIQKLETNILKKDHYFTREEARSSDNNVEPERYRCLKKVVYINHIPYLFTTQTNIEESQDTIFAIAMTTLVFFVILVLGLLFLNRKLSLIIWKPFRKILEQLKSFNLNQQKNIEFESTKITEFAVLQDSLHKLIEQNISIYRTQKEFTENASHELQTPLAIIKHKLDLLLQDENLTDQQYDIVETIHKALTRSSRINKNLLLLAKIENQQFDDSEQINFSDLINHSIQQFEEHFEQKNITLHHHIQEKIMVYGNSSLLETLINNLIINAIRHSSEGGNIDINLTKMQFEVANSGKEKLDEDQLFKRFSRGSQDSAGSGLGLAIIKEICKFQKWNIIYKFEDYKHHFIIPIQ